MTHLEKRCGSFAAGLAALVLVPAMAKASSHREAPFASKQPTVDGTDLYLFNSYEKGRQGFVTIIADYIPFQDPGNAPIFAELDSDAIYRINVDNSGAGEANLIIEFRAQNNTQDIQLPVGDKKVSVAEKNVMPVKDNTTLSRTESYTVSIYRGGPSAAPGAQSFTNKAGGSKVFEKPADNLGTKSIPDYETYARAHIYDVNIPGCDQGGRVFVGQRKEPFVVNVAEAFDLVNIKDPLGSRDQSKNALAKKNITSFVVEMPAACLAFQNHVIGAWTTALLPRNRLGTQITASLPAGVQTGAATDMIQVSRVSAPLVNELFIGMKDKDRFNSSQPKDDAQFADYVTNPTLPAILETVYAKAGVKAPTVFPRADLVQAFLTGVPGLNANGATAEMMRLNVTTPAKAAKDQNSLGVIDGDLAGFPNGRRPGDDVVDIELRVAMGKLLPKEQAPSGQLPLTDGAFVDASYFDEVFPYLRSPLAGSPQAAQKTQFGPGAAQ